MKKSIILIVCLIIFPNFSTLNSIIRKIDIDKELQTKEISSSEYCQIQEVDNLLSNLTNLESRLNQLNQNLVKLDSINKYK